VVWLVVDGSQLLGALPGDLDLDVALVGGERCFQAGPLPVGEVLDAGAQDVADPVERVGLAAAVAVDVLLDPAADLVECGCAEFDDVEGVQHRDGVGELVVDGVLVAMERVQGGDLNPLAERVAAVSKPRLVGLTRAARDQVQQPDPEVSVLVTGEIDHAGELFRPASAVVDGLGRDVVPHVFVDS